MATLSEVADNFIVQLSTENAYVWAVYKHQTLLRWENQFAGVTLVVVAAAVVCFQHIMCHVVKSDGCGAIQMLHTLISTGGVTLWTSPSQPHVIHVLTWSTHRRGPNKHLCWFSTAATLIIETWNWEPGLASPIGADKTNFYLYQPCISVWKLHISISSSSDRKHSRIVC